MDTCLVLWQSCLCITVLMPQRKRVGLVGWSTTVKLETARRGFTPSMERLTWSWSPPETSMQARSWFTIMAIGVKPQSLLTHGSNTETLTFFFFFPLIYEFVPSAVQFLYGKRCDTWNVLFCIDAQTSAGEVYFLSGFYIFMKCSSHFLWEAGLHCERGFL